MARGNSRAQSEAGTIARTETQARRIKDATKTLEGLSYSTKASDALDILTKPRSNNERYVIDMSGVTAGRDSNKMLQIGKLNLIDGTIEGQPINAATLEGPIDRIGSKSTKYYNTEYVAERANQQPGFVFATDGKDVYALPHSWDMNDPQGTVGVFRGDVIRTNGKDLNVIGSFDNTRRGLQSAAIAAGEAIGRDRGVKQTAIVLSHQTDKQSGIQSVRSGSIGTVFGSQTIKELNDGGYRYGVSRI
jgi:hypothetical protein